MPIVPLTLKVIKDEVYDVEGQPRPRFPQMRVLRMAFLPMHLYVRIETPLPATEDAQESNDLLSLHLVAAAGPESSAVEFRARTGIRPPPPVDPPRLRMRRMLALLSCPEAPHGRYQVLLVRHGKDLASVLVVKARQEVRVLTKQPPDPLRAVAPVLISGTPKSGTTWLQEVINAHPQFLVLHEAHALDLLDAEMLRDQLAARSDYFNARTITWLPQPYDPASLGRLLQLALARDLITRFGIAWGADFVADRTPGYAKLYSFLPDLWEDLRVVHIVRHPLDVMASWLFHELNGRRDTSRPGHLPVAALDRINARLEAGETIAPGDFLTDGEMAAGAFGHFARRWRREQRYVLAALGRGQHQFHVLTYEELSRDFAAAAGAVFAFLGTDPERTDLARIARESSFRKLSGGREPGQASNRSFFRKGVVGDWRSIFTPHQAGFIWRELAEAAGAFGYTIEPPGQTAQAAAAA